MELPNYKVTIDSSNVEWMVNRLKEVSTLLAKTLADAIHNREIHETVSAMLKHSGGKELPFHRPMPANMQTAASACESIASALEYSLNICRPAPPAAPKTCVPGTAEEMKIMQEEAREDRARKTAEAAAYNEDHLGPFAGVDTNSTLT